MNLVEELVFIYNQGGTEAVEKVKQNWFEALKQEEKEEEQRLYEESLEEVKNE